MPRIEVRDLRFTYPDGTVALRGIDLVIAERVPVAIIGQNGSGKTTLVRHFNGLLKPTSGSVAINGVDTRDRTPAQWARTVGYVFQNPDDQIFQTSVRRELEFGPRNLGFSKEKIEERVRYVADITGIASSQMSKHPYDLTMTERKVVAIASVLAADPEIVIFDEPTTGQDHKGVTIVSNIVSRLQSEGKLVLTISHDMEFVAKHFARVVVMSQGRVILDGTAKEVFARPDVLAETYVRPPYLTRLAQACGFEETPLSVEEFVEAVKARVRPR